MADLIVNRQKIQQLALHTIGMSGILDAEKLTNEIQGEGESYKVAVFYLADLFSDKLKRPLMYLRWDIVNCILERTRSIVFDCGMYLEHLVGFYRKDLYKRRSPFGRLLFFIKDSLPPNLYQNLLLFNEVFLIKAKHDIYGYSEEDHLFSIEDTVLCCLITKYLEQKIVSLSDSAKAHSVGEIQI
jgi:hypothetical protein